MAAVLPFFAAVSLEGFIFPAIKLLIADLSKRHADIHERIPTDRDEFLEVSQSADGFKFSPLP